MEVEINQKKYSEYLNLFKNELVGDEFDNGKAKIYTVKRIASVAKIIGPEETRNELLSFILTHIDSLEDEILFMLCEELELFLPLVGGQENAEVLFSILLKISRTVDETTVRNRTIEVIKELISIIDDEYIEKYIVSYLVESENNEVHFSGKCSTLSLIPICYTGASHANKIILRQKYCHVLEDTSTLIRKLAWQGFPQFVDILEMDYILNEIMPILTNAQENDQECVQIFIPEIALSIAKKSNNKEIRNDLLEIIFKASENVSWRIRRRISELIDEIAIVFHNQEFQIYLLEMYENLVCDSEIEVRVIAVKNMYKFMKNLRENQGENVDFDVFFTENCMPIVKHITFDGYNNVHIAFSSTILLLSKIISKECFTRTILPIIVDGLEKDKPLVYKENIFMNLDNLPDDVDLIKSLNSFNKIIQNILVSSENSWRTRRSLLLTFIHVSKFCTEEFFKKNFLIYYVILLKDNVFAVRRTATIILPILAKRFGAKWLVTEMMPHIHVTFQHEKYLIRYIILFCIQELINPSADEKCTQDNQIFLEDLKESPVKKLCKIIKLHENLTENLQEKPFKPIITTYTDDYNINGENVEVYSEELLETVQKYNINIFSIKNEEADEAMCYLEGILILLNKDILNILKMLIKDPINNIQERAKFVICKIAMFCNKLGNEIRTSEWVQNRLRKIEENVWNEIEGEINEQLENVHYQFEGVEKIDTDLMEIIASERKLSRHSIDSVKSLENIEVFPKDVCVKHEETGLHADDNSMEKVDEEVPRISK